MIDNVAPCSHSVNNTAEGKATVASDTMVEPITTALVPGMAFHRLWGGDAAPVFPDDGSPQPGEQYGWYISA